jgi:hypothetical protein
MKHLRIFNTDTEYWNFINGSGKTLPHVSLCDDNYKVYFNPKKKLDNYIQLSIVNTYAPGGVGANAPKIIATSDYPVGRDIVISGTCTAEDVFPTQETTNFSITILRIGHFSTTILKVLCLPRRSNRPFELVRRSLIDFDGFN